MFVIQSLIIVLINIMCVKCVMIFIIVNLWKRHILQVSTYTSLYKINLYLLIFSALNFWTFDLNVPNYGYYGLFKLKSVFGVIPAFLGFVLATFFDWVLALLCPIKNNVKYAILLSWNFSKKSLLLWILIASFSLL